MPKTPSTYALAILADVEIRTVVTVSKLQASALDQLAAIPRIEREAALRAILCGLTLHRVKASLPHGQFGPWVGQIPTSGSNLPGRAQVNFYMRLALTAVDTVKATVPEILSLPGDQTELALEQGEAGARRLMIKLVEFVGGRSLNQLLADHGIKDRKAATRRTAGGPPSEEAHEQTVQEAFNAIAEHLRLARKSATDKAVWLSFKHSQHEDLKYLFDDAAARITELFVKTHGRQKS